MSNHHKTHPPSTSTLSLQDEFWITKYLDLLQTLLAVDQAYMEDVTARSASTTNSSTTLDLCAASIVGLSALSSWCGTITTTTKSGSGSSRSSGVSLSTWKWTHAALLDAMNDLAHVVERATATYRDQLTFSLIPIKTM